MISKTKLTYYNILKQSHGYEQYLDIIRNGQARKVMTQLRSGTNDLEVEKGRRNKVQSPEDELHVLLYCSAYDELRKGFFRDILTLSQGKLI
jgi:hypothetical protein